MLTEQQRGFVNQFEAAVEARIADEDLAIDDLAEALSQSRATLYRKIKQACERSPSDLVREICFFPDTAHVRRSYGLRSPDAEFGSCPPGPTRTDPFCNGNARM